MAYTPQIEEMKKQGRKIEQAVSGDSRLGPLSLLPGTWANEPGLRGRGWNMIALPFAGGEFRYRLLVNQYNETLKFSSIDGVVPNRGIPLAGTGIDGDQSVIALDYEQTIKQIKAEDSPVSGEAGTPNMDIHHEPGLWLWMTDQNTNNLNIARLATIPHGNSALALGTSQEINGAPVIFNTDGLPDVTDQDLDNNRYLSPYKHFDDNPFKGEITAPDFPGFNPIHPNELLKLANQGVNIVKTTELTVDTKIEDAGIVNIPFIEKQADATEMKSTFWIQELAEKDTNGNPKLRLQYTQLVFLDFFKHRDGRPGLIRWPHVSINTLEKIAE